MKGKFDMIPVTSIVGTIFLSFSSDHSGADPKLPYFHVLLRVDSLEQVTGKSLLANFILHLSYFLAPRSLPEPKSKLL